MNVQNSASIVTGGASGLGAATAKRLAEAGSRVAILDRNAALGEALAQEIGGLFIKADVSDEAGVSRALDQACAVHGVARVLVNCAGAGRPTMMVGRDGRPSSLEIFAWTLSVNLVGAYNVMAQFASRLIAAEPVGEERGVVVNTASVAAFEGQIGQTAYAASKAGLAGLTLPAARELARHRIRVMAIAPGVFETPMLDGLSEEMRQSLGSQVPFPSRLGVPDEYARLVMAIVDNPMLNGDVIRLDGSIRMGPR